VDRIKIAPDYDSKYLEIERPQPLTDKKIDTLIQQVLHGCLDKDISNEVYNRFKFRFVNWLSESKRNSLYGLKKFNRIDIINGCTQFIDNIYMHHRVQTLVDDYRYHSRLNLSYLVTPKNLIHGVPLIIAMPFPQIGSIHNNMQDILSECAEKKIDVHIDGAWVTTCTDIEFDFNHPNIKSVGISLSKGLGLGWNRIGLRWSNEDSDSITIMNDFHMNNKALVMIGSYFLDELVPDYLWNTHEHRYKTICKDFNLTETKSIYLALKNGMPVGVSPLIRYLEENGI